MSIELNNHVEWNYDKLLTRFIELRELQKIPSDPKRDHRLSREAALVAFELVSRDKDGESRTSIYRRNDGRR